MGGENSARPQKGKNSPPKGNEDNHPNISGVQAAEITKLEAVNLELMELLCSKREGMTATEVGEAIKLHGQCQARSLSVVLRSSMEGSTSKLPTPAF